jgi:hypothetical protein
MSMHAINSVPRSVKAALIAGSLVASAAVITASAIPASAASDVLISGGLGAQESFTCANTTHAIAGDVIPVNSVANGCGVRVWLHQYSDGSGWSYCISPSSYVNITGKYQDALQAYVSSNTASC